MLKRRFQNYHLFFLTTLQRLCACLEIFKAKTGRKRTQPNQSQTGQGQKAGLTNCNFSLSPFLPEATTPQNFLPLPPFALFLEAKPFSIF